MALWAPVGLWGQPWDVPYLVRDLETNRVPHLNYGRGWPAGEGFVAQAGRWNALWHVSETGAGPALLVDRAGGAWLLEDGTVLADGGFEDRGKVWRTDGSQVELVSESLMISGNLPHGVAPAAAAGGAAYVVATAGWWSDAQLWELRSGIAPRAIAPVPLVYDPSYMTYDGCGDVAVAGDGVVFCGRSNQLEPSLMFTNGETTRVLRAGSVFGLRSVGRFAVGAVGSELIATDGSVAGTFVVGTSANLETLVELPDATIVWTEWDGTTQRLRQANLETRVVKELGLVSGSMLGPLGEGLLFSRFESAFGAEPWWWFSGSMSLVADLEPGSGGSDVHRYVALGKDRGLLIAQTDKLGREAWITDGTEQGTELLANSAPGSAHGVRYGEWPVALEDGSLVLQQVDESGLGQPWRLDLSGAFAPFGDLRLPGNAGSGPWIWGRSGDEALVQASTEDFGVGLWLTDGTELGTRLAVDQPWVECSSGYAGSLVAPHWLLECLEPEEPLGVWQRQAGGFERVGEIETAGAFIWSHAVHPLAAGAGLVVRIDSRLLSWSEASGTIDLGCASAGPFRAGAQVVFIPCASSGTQGLWVTDGTPGSVQPLFDPGVDLGELTQVGTRVVFRAATGAAPSVQRTWSTDGTAAGTFEIGPWFSIRAVVGSQVCAIGPDAEGWWFWRLDPATAVVSRLGAGPVGAVAWNLWPPDGSMAWFRAGGDLWRCDATLEGTRRVGAIPPSWSLRGRTRSAGGLWVEAQLADGSAVLGHLDASTGAWQVTSLSSLQHNDEGGGGVLSLPWGVLFTKADADHGRELWGLRTRPRLFVDGFESASLSAWSATVP